MFDAVTREALRFPSVPIQRISEFLGGPCSMKNTEATLLRPVTTGCDTKPRSGYKTRSGSLTHISIHMFETLSRAEEMSDMVSNLPDMQESK